MIHNFGEIYAQYYQRSLLFVQSYVRDRMVAEDIVSESMLKLWQTLRSQTVVCPQALLLSILKHTSLNYLKRQEMRSETLEQMSAWLASDLKYRINTLEACHPAEIYSSEISTLLSKALSDLPQQTCRIFVMRRHEALSVKAIAETLSMSPKTVEYHITKAVKALRMALKDYLPLLLALCGL